MSPTTSKPRGGPAPKWEQFEKAVAKFAKALDPAAKVVHDIRLPDRQTARPRQRDVWIEAKICQHYPVKVLVSCKRWQRKMHSGDIDAFCGELQSSGAHKGVVYAYGGYTRPALEKASALGIDCCQLYKGEPPELPEQIAFDLHLCTQSVWLALKNENVGAWSLETFGDALAITDHEQGRQVADAIEVSFREAEERAVADLVSSTGVWPPEVFEGAVEVQHEGRPPLRIVLQAKWKWWRARLEAYILDGSYSFTGEEFIGRTASPSIDVQRTHPGPGWELLEKPPERKPAAFVVLGRGDLANVFQQLGRQRIP